MRRSEVSDSAGAWSSTMKFDEKSTKLLTIIGLKQIGLPETPSCGYTLSDTASQTCECQSLV